VTEAIHFLGVPASSLDVLSIGTVGTVQTISRSKRLGGILQWNTSVVELLMRGQAEAAVSHATLITGHRFHRIDKEVEDGRFSMDDASAVEELVALGAGEARLRPKPRCREPLPRWRPRGSLPSARLTRL
jgi:hypothetical protein